MKSFLPIETVSKQIGLSAHTLRYYERIGLIKAIPRGPGGARRYAVADMAWIEFLLRLRSTGMSIKEMLKFAELRSQGDSTIPERKKMLEIHLSETERKVQEIELSLASLREKIVYYQRAESYLLSNTTQERENHGKPTLSTRAGKIK